MTACPCALAPGSAEPFYCGSVGPDCVLPVQGLTLSAAVTSQIQLGQDHGSLYCSSIPARTNVQVSFVYSSRKEEMWQTRG